MKEALSSPLTKQVLLILAPLAYYPMAWALFSFVRFKTVWDALSYFGPILYCIGLIHILSFIFLHNYLKRIGLYEDVAYVYKTAVEQTKPYFSYVVLKQRYQILSVQARMWSANLTSSLRVFSLRRSTKALR